jgi:hypothetical protein
MLAADQTLGQGKMAAPADHQLGVPQGAPRRIGQAVDAILADADDGQPGRGHGITRRCGF